jgi:hypothetical protein
MLKYFVIFAIVGFAVGQGPTGPGEYFSRNFMSNLSNFLSVF